MVAAPWQPKSFRRFELALKSSTYAAQIVTDAGRAVIKVINNPIGPHALVREWVGTNLAQWFGLPTFDFAILELDEIDEIILYDGRRAKPGPAFVTRTVKGHPWGGAVEELKSLDNPEAISWLVVFDTWILNPDRYPPDGSTRQPHLDNVFLSEEAQPGKFRLIAMDHTECIVTSGRDLTGSLASIERVKDERIYGLFPEFRPFIVPSELCAAAARLRELDRDIILSIVEAIPSAWEVEDETRAALGNLILERAAYVADTVVERVRTRC